MDRSAVGMTSQQTERKGERGRTDCAGIRQESGVLSVSKADSGCNVGVLLKHASEAPAAIRQEDP